jgi:hypothetical protein
MNVGSESTKGYDYTVFGLGVGVNLANQNPECGILPCGFKADTVAIGSDTQVVRRMDAQVTRIMSQKQE